MSVHRGSNTSEYRPSLQTETAFSWWSRRKNWGYNVPGFQCHYGDEMSPEEGSPITVSQTYLLELCIASVFFLG